MRRRRFRRRRAPIRRRRIRRRRTRLRRRGHRSSGRIYYFRLRRKDKITLDTTTAGDFKFGCAYFTFQLANVLSVGQNAPVLKVPFEYYQIPLVKVEMRPLGTEITTWKGFGHTCPMYDARIKTFQQTGLGDDPLMDFDGARKWDLRKGFKRLLRPKPQITINDLATANQTATTWFSNQRNQWIPLQTAGGNLFPTKVNYYGLAFSYLHPAPDALNYEVEVTYYVKFRQFAWTTLNIPPTPNIEGLELMHVCDGNCNQCWADDNLDPDSAVESE
ncbi:capsid protein [Columbid circovirus]|uniref:Capsid protein n=1 Tax=Pigeon circovirus TaxID=126070 RepID=Q3YLD0_PICV|nr:capsid protein [Columbid circovirus]